MKCGNDRCDYELYLDELDFVICPKCGELIRRNLQPEHFKKLFLTGQTERFRTTTRWLERTERALQVSPFVLLVLSEFFVLGMGGSVLAESAASAGGVWGFQLVREIQNVLGLSALCFVINKAYDYVRIGFMGSWWHHHLWPHLLIKTVIYGMIAAYVHTYPIPEFAAYLAHSPKTSAIPGELVQFGLRNAYLWFIGLAWWTLIAYFLSDMVDTYNGQRVFLMNKIILTKPIE